MAKGLTVKMENFCQKCVELGNKTEAYRQAYSSSEMKEKTIVRKAQELMELDKIKERIEELKQRVLIKHDVTIEGLLKELEEARAIAATTETPQTSSMISATMGKAKLTGLLTDKVETSGPGGKPIETKWTIEFLNATPSSK